MKIKNGSNKMSPKWALKLGPLSFRSDVLLVNEARLTWAKITGVLCSILTECDLLDDIFVRLLHKKIWREYLTKNWLLFQEEMEKLNGYYCEENNSMMTDIWGPVITITQFASFILIPFSLIAHNYARIGRTLFRSVKDNTNQKERIYTQ